MLTAYRTYHLHTNPSLCHLDVNGYAVLCELCVVGTDLCCLLFEQTHISMTEVYTHKTVKTMGYLADWAQPLLPQQ